MRDAVAEEALDWFVRLEASAGDAETLAHFRAWRESDRRRAAAFEKVASIWRSPELDAALRSTAAAEVRSRATYRRAAPAASRSRGRWGRRLAVAAALVAVFAFGAAQLPEFLLHMRADYVTQTGSRRTVQLPDGSTMVLNTASAVSLDFEGGKRQVTLLEGEAFFDVVADTAHPFLVTAHFGETQVRGTEFSVRAGEEEDTVSLREGLIDVGRLGLRAERVRLEAGHAVTVSQASISRISDAEARQSLAWLEGRISFRDRPFGKVLDDLRRYYRGRIVVANGGLSRIRVSGDYRLDEPALVIRSLAEATGAAMTELPGGLIILR